MMQHFNSMRLAVVCGALLGAIFSAGCSITGAEIVQRLSSIPPSTDSTYGYTIKNPVLLGEFGSGSEASFAASHYFVAGLRKNGRPLMLLRQSLVEDMTDAWTAVPEGTTDTMYIYINVYKRGSIRVPQGLTLDMSGFSR